MNPEIILRKDQLHRITGILLGDGYLSKPRKNGGGCQLVLRHCEKQLEYLRYKIEYLRLMGVSMSDPHPFYTTLSNGKTYKGYSSQSSFLKVFVKLRKKLYPRGRKTIRVPVVSNLTIEDLVHIIFDDGSIQRASNKGVPKYAGINIAFDCFTYKENEIFLKLVKRNLGIAGTIHYKKGQPYIYFGMINSYKIVQLGLDYFNQVECLKYKWNAFNISIIDSEPRVLNNSESLSDREIATRLMLKYLIFPHSDKKSDKELICKLYGTVPNFERSVKISTYRSRVKDMIQLQ